MRVLIQGNVNFFGPVPTNQREASIEFVTSHGANILSYVAQLKLSERWTYFITKGTLSGGQFCIIANKNLISIFFNCC